MSSPYLPFLTSLQEWDDLAFLRKLTESRGVGGSAPWHAVMFVRAVRGEKMQVCRWRLAPYDSTWRLAPYENRWRLAPSESKCMTQRLYYVFTYAFKYFYFRKYTCKGCSHPAFDKACTQGPPSPCSPDTCCHGFLSLCTVVQAPAGSPDLCSTVCAPPSPWP